MRSRAAIASAAALVFGVPFAAFVAPPVGSGATTHSAAHRWLSEAMLSAS
jgi:hypothetical protein